MKTIFKSTLLLVSAATVLFIHACTQTEDEPTSTPSTTRSATFMVNGVKKSVAKPYNGIFNNNGVISNSVSLTAGDKSKITFSFKGKSPATYPLKEYPDAVYTDSSGQNYNAYKGTLVVSEYKVDDYYTFSGTFNFVAISINNPNDSVVITEGVITNCSNKF